MASTWGELGDALGGPLRPARGRRRRGAGRGAAGQQLAGRRRLAVADQEDEGGWSGRRPWVDESSSPWASANLRVRRADSLVPAARTRSSRAVACPRLVAWREQVAVEKRAAYRDEDYWGRPIPGFGDPAARDPRARPGAGGPRCQPHGSGVHRRPLGRLAVPGDAPGRAGQPADVACPPTTGWSCAARG